MTGRKPGSRPSRRAGARLPRARAASILAVSLALLAGCAGGGSRVAGARVLRL